MKKSQTWWYSLTTKTKRELCNQYHGAASIWKTLGEGEIKVLHKWHTDREKRLKKEAVSLVKWVKTQTINIRTSFGGRVSKKLNYGVDHKFEVVKNGKSIFKTKNAVEAIKKYESI